MDDGFRMVRTRTCGAWVLPGDPTCAGVARRLFRRVASELALETEAIDDGVTMVSELAANTLHASQQQSLPVNPELWLYLRGTGHEAELVCKVFDILPGWVRGNVPGRTVCRAPADAMSGRGLEVVHELSSGYWGHHLTRSRLSGTGIRGKAVWFAVPVPAAGADGKRHPITAGDAMTELEQLDRGWYAAPVGWMDATEDGEFCVALRSALLRDREAHLFAGVGVVAGSDPEAELAETEVKLGALLPLLAE